MCIHVYVRTLNNWRASTAPRHWRELLLLVHLLLLGRARGPVRGGAALPLLSHAPLPRPSWTLDHGGDTHPQHYVATCTSMYTVSEGMERFYRTQHCRLGNKLRYNLSHKKTYSLLASDDFRQTRGDLSHVTVLRAINRSVYVCWP